jgi:hypothetical protein
MFPKMLAYAAQTLKSSNPAPIKDHHDVDSDAVVESDSEHNINLIQKKKKSKNVIQSN